MNLSKFTKAKSDQLNADDLIGGPITVPVLGVREGSAEQPVIIDIGGGHMPWKPSKTALRLLVHGWGEDTDDWPETPWITLYRDDSVTFGKERVGGIRPSHMSHVEPFKLALAERRGGKKKMHHVQTVRPPQRPEGKPTANLLKLLKQHGLSHEQVDGWLAGRPKDPRPIRERSAEECSAMAAYLAQHPQIIEEMKQ